MPCSTWTYHLLLELFPQMTAHMKDFHVWHSCWQSSSFSTTEPASALKMSPKIVPLRWKLKSRKIDDTHNLPVTWIVGSFTTQFEFFQLQNLTVPYSCVASINSHSTAWCSVLGTWKANTWSVATRFLQHNMYYLSRKKNEFLICRCHILSSKTLEPNVILGV